MDSGFAFYSPLAGEVGGSLNWTFFAADGVLAGFQHGTSVETVTAIWRVACRSGATLESVVGSIPTRGPVAIESFVVALIGERVSIVARGLGSADVITPGGQRRIDSRRSQPWYLAEFDGVVGLALGSSERPIGAESRPAPSDLPMLSGLVRAPWLGWTASAAAGGAGTGAERTDQHTAAIASAGPSSSPITGSQPVQKRVAPAPSASAIAAPELPPLPPASAPPMAEGSRAGADVDPLGDTVRGVGTGRWSLLSESEPAAATAGPGRTDTAETDIGDTVLTERSRHRADVPPVTSWSPARIEFDPRFSTRGSAAGYYCFRIGEGQTYRLDTPVYIGRKPSSPRIVTGTIPRLLKVPSPSMEVSGTHIELRQEGGSVVVTDMRSTNGTFVALPGAAHVKLRQGESLVLTPGAVVDIGDGNVIEILPIR